MYGLMVDSFFYCYGPLSRHSSATYWNKYTNIGMYLNCYSRKFYHAVVEHYRIPYSG